MEGDETSCQSADLQSDRSQKTDSKKNGGGNAKKRRIMYSKDFLVKCFRHPLSAKRPRDFPLTNLDCTLTTPRIVGKNPLPAMTTMVPKRKDEFVKKETEVPDDSISLRPQRATFSSGCAPNLSPNPNRYPLNMDSHNRSFSERDSLVPRATTNSRFNFNNQRTWNDNLPKTRESGESFDRDREKPDEAGSRRFLNRDKNRPDQNRVPATKKEFVNSSWTTEPESSDWNRRRGNDRNQNNQGQSSSRSAYMAKSGPNYKADEEPEWYSVPMSHNDTIELCGLPGDTREMKKTERKSKVSNGSQHMDSSTDESMGNDKPTLMDFSILDAGMDLADEPLTSKIMSSISSRYTDFFASQPEGPDKCLELSNNLMDGGSDERDITDMGNQLRNILFPGHQKPINPKMFEKIKKETPQEQPAPARKSEEQFCFEQILDQLVEKGTKKSIDMVGSNFGSNQASGMGQASSGNAMSLPLSRPGSSNAPSTVHEIYSDPLHPFTKLVRDIHNGLPMGISEFVPRDPTPTKCLREEGHPMPFPGRRQSDEERMMDQRRMSLAAQEYHDSIQRQLKGKIQDMQVPQRGLQMEPSHEFENRNGPIQIPQPMYRGAPINLGNGPMPIQQGHQHIQQNGPPMSTYSRPHQYGPGVMNGPGPINGPAPMNLYTEQMQNNQQPEFTAAQVMSYLPYEIQILVSNSTASADLVGRPEFIKCLNSIKNSEINLHDIICQLSSPNLAQRHMMAAILKFCFQGHIKLRGLAAPTMYRVNVVPSMTGPPPQMMPLNMMLNQHHQFPHGTQYPRAVPLPLPPRFFRAFDSQANSSVNAPIPGMNFPSNPPTAPPAPAASMSSMAFTPTAVMRQMTAGPEQRNQSSR